MKKILMLCVVILFLAGCEYTPKKDKIVETYSIIAITQDTTKDFTDKETESTTKEVTETVTEDRAEENALNYKYNVVPNLESAAELATVIFKHAEKPKGTENYKYVTTTYSQKDKIWTVLFSEGDYGQICYAEADYCVISIDAKSGEVIWLYFRTAEQQAEINKKIGKSRST